MATGQKPIFENYFKSFSGNTFKRYSRNYCKTSSMIFVFQNFFLEYYQKFIRMEILSQNSFGNFSGKSFPSFSRNSVKGNHTGNPNKILSRHPKGITLEETQRMPSGVSLEIPRRAPSRVPPGIPATICQDIIFRTCPGHSSGVSLVIPS